MQSTLYIALSAQLALQDRLDTIAQNVANGTTAGYRASEVKFDSVLSNSGGAPVTFVSSGSQTIRRATGELVKTGNPLDVAVKGDGWLSVASPQGQTYTRDGRMQMNAAGSSGDFERRARARRRRRANPARSFWRRATNCAGRNDQPGRQTGGGSRPIQPAK